MGSWSTLGKLLDADEVALALPVRVELAASVARQGSRGVQARDGRAAADRTPRPHVAAR